MAAGTDYLLDAFLRDGISHLFMVPGFYQMFSAIYQMFSAINQGFAVAPPPGAPLPF